MLGSVMSPRLSTSLTALLVGISTNSLTATIDQRIMALESEVSHLRDTITRLQNQQAYTPGRSHSLSNTHTIRRGDTFWDLSREYRVSMRSLRNANSHMHPRRLRIGAKMTIPGQSKSIGAPEFSTSLTTSTISYTVQPGDTLGHIAEQHDIKLRHLINANPRVKPRRLRIGSTLQIPGQKTSHPAPTFDLSTPPPLPDVEPVITAEPAVEETIPEPNSLLEKRPSITPDPLPETPSILGGLDLPELNLPAPEPELTPEEPEPKEKLELPALDLPEPKPAPKPTPKKSPNKLIKVAKEARFHEIATAHNTTVDHLNKINNLALSSAQKIQAGSEILVPNND